MRWYTIPFPLFRTSSMVMELRSHVRTCKCTTHTHSQMHSKNFLWLFSSSGDYIIQIADPASSDAQLRCHCLAVLEVYLAHSSLSLALSFFLSVCDTLLPSSIMCISLSSLSLSALVHSRYLESPTHP